MGTPSSNQYFEAIHSGPGTPQDPNLFSAAEIVAGSFDSAAVSTATSKAVSTISAAAPDSTNLSIADSKGVSSGSRASIADSKAVSDSSNISVVDSKVSSGSVNTSIADSKAISSGFFASAPSAIVSTADSKAVSVGTATLSLIPTRSVNVKASPYNAVGDGVTDDLAAITLARTAALLTGAELIFPAGTYGLTDTLNLGFTGLASRAQGTVIFKRLGAIASPVVSLDSGANTLSVLNIKMRGDFRIQGTAFSTKGLYTRGCSHSDVECTVMDGAGMAFHVNWSVCSRFWLTESSNLAAFTNTPTVGLQVDETATGRYTADCEFYVILEAVNGTGLYVKSGSGNTFRGTAEGITGKGIVEDSGCNRNIFEEFDCEGNTVSDAELSGGGTILRNSYMGSASSSPNVLANGNALQVIGGTVRWISLVGNDTLFQGVKLSDNGGLGIQGSGTYRTIGSMLVDVNGVTTSRLADKLGITALPRLTGNGTTHVIGDYVLSAGWGVGSLVRLAAAGAQYGARDTGGSVAIDAAGTPSANPTVTLTFKDGAWAVIPTVTCNRGELTTPTTAFWITTTITATTCVFQFVGLPAAGGTYVLNYSVIGK